MFLIFPRAVLTSPKNIPRTPYYVLLVYHIDDIMVIEPYEQEKASMLGRSAGKRKEVKSL